MKKIYLLFIPLLMAFVSCEKETKTGEGSITVTVEYANKLVTPEIEMTDLDYKLSGKAESEGAMPADGKIESLTEGDYKIVVSTAAQPAPSFDPEYTGEKSFSVVKDADTPVGIEMKQASAGIYFVYDGVSSSVVPEVSGTGGSLTYEGSDRESIGYFKAGTATVSFQAGIKINGEEDFSIPVVAGSNYKLVLSESASGLTAVVYVYDTVTGDETGIQTPDTLNMAFTRATGVYYGATANGTGRFVITFTDDDETAEFVLEGYSDMFADPSIFEPAGGAYTVSSEEALFAVSAAGTYYNAGNSNVTVSGGTVELTFEEGVLAMATRLQGRETTVGYDLAEIGFTFNGALEFTSEAADIDFVPNSMPALSMFYYGATKNRDNAMLQFEIMYDIPGGGYDCMVVTMHADVPANDEDPERAVFEGIYRFSDSMESMTFAPGYIDEYGEPQGTYSYTVVNNNGVNELSDVVLIDGGTVIMRLTEEYNPDWWNQKYEVLVYGTGINEEGGRENKAYKADNHVAVYNDTPGPDEHYDLTFTSAKSDHYGDFTSLGFSNATLELAATVDGVTYTLSLDLYMELVNGQLEIAPGTYTASSTREPGVFYKGFRDTNGLALSCMTGIQGWNLTVDATITGGTVEIAKSGDTYTVTVDVTGNNNETKLAEMFVKGTYEGPVTFSQKYAVSPAAKVSGAAR